MNYSVKTEMYLDFPDIECASSGKGLQVWNSGETIDFGWREGMDPVIAIKPEDFRAFAQALLDHADELIGEEDETI